jgi:hypothetical protein
MEKPDSESAELAVARESSRSAGSPGQGSPDGRAPEGAQGAGTGSQTAGNRTAPGSPRGCLGEPVRVRFGPARSAYADVPNARSIIAAASCFWLGSAFA